VFFFKNVVNYIFFKLWNHYSS